MILKVTNLSSNVIQEISSLQFGARMYQQGGISRGVAVLGAISSGVGRGLNAAQMTKEYNAKVESGAIRYGTEADRRADQTNEMGKTALRLFGINI